MVAEVNYITVGVDRERSSNGGKVKHAGYSQSSSTTLLSLVQSSPTLVNNDVQLSPATARLNGGLHWVSPGHSRVQAVG